MKSAEMEKNEFEYLDLSTLTAIWHSRNVKNPMESKILKSGDPSKRRGFKKFKSKNSSRWLWRTLSWNLGKISKPKAVIWHFQTMIFPSQGLKAVFLIPMHISSSTIRVSTESLMKEIELIITEKESYGSIKISGLFWSLQSVRTPFQGTYYLTFERNSSNKCI